MRNLHCKLCVQSILNSNKTSCFDGNSAFDEFNTFNGMQNGF